MIEDMQARRDPGPPPAAAGLPAGALADRLARELERARHLQQSNLLVRLVAETLHVRLGQTRVVVAAERCLRQG